MDQTSASASKPGPSTSAVNLDLPPPRPRTTSHVEEMDVDYGPALPPCLGSDIHNASDQNSNASEEPSKKVSDRPNNTLTKGMRLNRGLPWINTMINALNLGFHLLNPKNMLKKVDIRSGLDTCHLPQENQSSTTRHRSSKPSGAQPSGALSDQDQPQP